MQMKSCCQSRICPNTWSRDKGPGNWWSISNSDPRALARALSHDECSEVMWISLFPR